MPALKWNIIYYLSSSKQDPVFEFIQSLSPTAKAKIINTFDLLSEYGIRLGLPHVKKVVGTNLWELRILGGDNIRVFYVAISGKTFLLLHGFIKKTKKTQKKEIKVALSRLKEYRSKHP